MALLHEGYVPNSGAAALSFHPSPSSPFPLVPPSFPVNTRPSSCRMICLAAMQRLFKAALLNTDNFNW